jgi:N-hydroxyarylamine O-acetyltransferase
MKDVRPYLDRIGYRGPTASTTEVLGAIHRQHLLSVPFENLDIGLGREIVVDEDAFAAKVVERRRGGFCYELNGAFAALLRSLGFRVTLLSARVAKKTGEWGPEYDHLALRVDLDEPWLADVGFGELFLEPLQMKAGIEQTDTAGRFRLVQSEDRFQLEKAEGYGWKKQYSFGLHPRRLEDFAGMCHYHQTSPESSFTQKRICSRATPGGRITLADMNLIVTRNGHREERMLTSEREWEETLREEFGVLL